MSSLIKRIKDIKPWLDEDILSPIFTQQEAKEIVHINQLRTAVIGLLHTSSSTELHIAHSFHLKTLCNLEQEIYEARAKPILKRIKRNVLIARINMALSCLFVITIISGVTT